MIIISLAYYFAMAEKEVPITSGIAEISLGTGIVTDEYFRAVEKGDVQIVKEIFREKGIRATSYKVR